MLCFSCAHVPSQLELHKGPTPSPPAFRMISEVAPCPPPARKPSSGAGQLKCRQARSFKLVGGGACAPGLLRSNLPWVPWGCHACTSAPQQPKPPCAPALGVLLWLLKLAGPGPRFPGKGAGQGPAWLPGSGGSVSLQYHPRSQCQLPPQCIEDPQPGGIAPMPAFQANLVAP